MRIPSRENCYQLIREMRMMEHIVRHSLQVCRVAELLVQQLGENGRTLNRDLVQAAALLHDITKTRSLKTGEKHSESGCDLLVDRGYAEVGDIVRQHVKLDTYFASDTPSEAEIVNYADKRVLHDRIVSLDERMAYILERYGATPEYRARLRWLWDISNLQEKRIFAEMPFPPADIVRHMEKVDLSVELQKVLSPIEPLV
ncbi:MAG: HD domain-containing protein [Desulfobacterales bacterium]|jgi:putative nucleotidyltransferase with HDIG domain